MNPSLGGVLTRGGPMRLSSRPELMQDELRLAALALRQKVPLADG